MARMGHLDKGARDAAGRRRQLELEKKRVRSEQAAYHAADVRGRGGHPWEGWLTKLAMYQHHCDNL